MSAPTLNELLEEMDGLSTRDLEQLAEAIARRIKARKEGRK